MRPIASPVLLLLLLSSCLTLVSAFALPAPALHRARTLFRQAIESGGPLGRPSHQVTAVLGELHLLVLLGELDLDQALRRLATLRKAWAETSPYTMNTVGAFWHLPDGIEATLRGEAWYPGKP